MKIIREHVVVKVDSIFNDATQYKGVDGIKLFLNPSFNPELHTRCHGIVTSVPDELYAYPLLADSLGQPGYHDMPKMEYKTNRDIELDVQVGDKVYFHYNCLLPDNMAENQYNILFLHSKKDEQGTLWYYFRIKYDLLFASVRYEKLNDVVQDFSWENEAKLKPITIATQASPQDKIYGYTDARGYDQLYRRKVVMIGSYVFVEPDLESWEDISRPTPVVVNGKVMLNPDGSVKLRPKEEWIVTKALPSEKYLRGWVRYCGSPLKGDKEFVRPGMYVYFQRHANTKVKFEGFDYFRMRQRHIMCIDPAKTLSLN